MSFTLIEDEFFSSQPYIPISTENNKKRSLNDDNGYNMGSNKKRKLNESILEFNSDDIESQRFIDDSYDISDINDGEMTDTKWNDDTLPMNTNENVPDSEISIKSISIHDNESSILSSNKCVKRKKRKLSESSDMDNKTDCIDTGNNNENDNGNNNDCSKENSGNILILGRKYELNLGKKTKILTLKSLNNNEIVFESTKEKQIKLTRYNGMNSNNKENRNEYNSELKHKKRKERKRIKAKKCKKKSKNKESKKKVETEEDIDLDMETQPNYSPTKRLLKSTHNKWTKDEEQLMVKLSKSKKYVYHQTTKTGNSIKKIKWKKAFKDNKSKFTKGRTWSCMGINIYNYVYIHGQIYTFIIFICTYNMCKIYMI